jgi:hypothetical protein
LPISPVLTRSISSAIAQVALEADQAGGVAGDPADLVAGLVDRRRGVDPEHPARAAAGVLEGGEPSDHASVRRAGDRADDDGVEDDAELLLLLDDLVGPVR